MRERAVHLFRSAQIGQCVNSVTHDVNNCLGAIMAYAELVSMDQGLSADSTRMLREVIEAVRKSSALVGNLTDIARQQSSDVRIVGPAQLAERALDLQRYNVKVSGIALETDYEADLAAIAVDLPRIERALVSLLTNAIEALEGGVRGSIRVSAAERDGAVEIVVWDSGPGVAEDVRERVFAPFYTTKEGVHIGLGLTTAREAARLHDGELAYDPERGFVLELPRNSRLAKEGPRAE